MFQCFITFAAALESGEGIVALGVRVRVCVSAEPRLHAVGGEGNALYPVLSRFTFAKHFCKRFSILNTC